MADESPLSIGTYVQPWGTITAISCRDGERYYMLIHGNESVALMPAKDVEDRYAEQNRGR